MDFSGATGINNLDIEFSSHSTTAPILSPIELSCRAIDVKLQSLKGDFGNAKVDVPSDNFDFNIDGFEKFVEGLLFTNPILNLNIENQLGFDIALELELEGENEAGIKKTLSSDPLIISKPNNYGDISQETLSLNKTNSTLPDFLSIAPNQLTYGGSTEINTGTAPFQNYLHKDFHCKGDLDIQIPLEIKVNDLKYETLMEDTDLLDESSDEIKSAELLFKVTNTFPLDANIQLLLMDNLLNSLDTIDIPLLKAAQVDNNGVTTTPGIHTFEVEFTEANIQNLYDTENLKFIGNLTSTDGGTKSVKIKDSYNIEIKLAVKVEAAVSTGNN